jgi:DNA-binding response OmpR family regulator
MCVVRLLHVEDDLFQQEPIRAVLNAPPLTCTITPVTTEEAAVTTFAAGFDLVILDYQLAHGNGLSCLKRLRELDTQVPIIALSGAATPEIAADLLEAGADDYFAKADLDADAFRAGVSAALTRVEARKTRGNFAAFAEINRDFERLATVFTLALTQAEVPALVSRFEHTARTHRLTIPQTRKLFDSISDPVTRRVLRPLLLELLLRLFDETDLPVEGA